MTIIAFGINHNTASVDLREKVAFTPDSLADAFASLKNIPDVSGSVVLSTCNRTEIYLEAVDSANSNFVYEWLANFHQIDEYDVKKQMTSRTTIRFFILLFMIFTNTLISYFTKMGLLVSFSNSTPSSDTACNTTFKLSSP